VQSFTGAFPQGFLAFQDKLIFNANGIYISDGTQAGTVQLLNGIALAGTVYQGKYFGIARNESLDRFLFSTDGTSSGSQNIMPLGTGGYMSGTIPILNNKMLIFSSDEVNGPEPRLTDGTVNGTTLLKDIAPGTVSSDPSIFQKIGDNKVVFLANDVAHGKELWQTDGTPAGTSLLKDANAGTESACVPAPSSFVTLPTSDNVFFFADKEELGPRDLWQSDGTDAGTKLYYNFSGYANLIGLMGDNDMIFFDDKRFLRSNGKPQETFVFKDLSAEIGSFYQLGFSGSVTLNGKFIFFFGTYSEFLNLGGELWITDGTYGASVLKDIRPGAGSAMQNLNGSKLGNNLLFAADDGVVGSELWITDGTTAGTKLLMDLRPGASGSGPNWFVTFGNAVYFGADDGVNGPAMWKTDGTASGTVMVKSFSSTGNPIPRTFAAAGDYVVFSAWDEANGWATWRSDGTTAGTSLVKDINPSKEKSLILGNYFFLKDHVYFSGDDGTHGYELWISDGTPGSTLLIDLDAGPVNSFPQYFTRINDVVYFSAAGKLWKTDGSPENTVAVSNIEPRSPFILKNEWIYFIGSSDDFGTELFKLRYEPFTAVEEFDELGISLYPNPVSNTLQIASAVSERVSVSLMDMRGTILSSFMIDANTTGMHDVSQYPTGLYLVSIKSTRGTVVRKILKK
jgi:ELWxxDGT repeat protein